MRSFVNCFIIAACLFASCESYHIEVPEHIQPVSFNNDILPILVSNCHSCHETGKVFPGLILSTDKAYDQLLFDGVNAPYVDTIDPEASKLYYRLNKDMPQFGLLPSSKIAMILKWIQDGAKND